MARMKISNFDSFRGLYFHISAPINVISGTGARAYCQISRFWGQCVAPAGRKTHFWSTE